MIKKIFLLFCFLFLLSCNNIELVLKDNNFKSLFKNNISLVFEGEIEEMFVEEVLLFFGNTKQSDFVLITTFAEKKENMFVKKNQVAEKIDYELIVNYKIFDNNQLCEIFNKEIITNFSFVPKSFGYNFGTDRSLEQLYRGAVKKNIQNFISLTPLNTTPPCI